MTVCNDLRGVFSFFNSKEPLLEVDFCSNLKLLDALRDLASSNHAARPSSSNKSVVKPSPPPVEPSTGGELSFTRCDKESSWDELISVLSEAFPVVPNGPATLTPELVESRCSISSSDVRKSQKSIFVSFLRAVSHPRTVQSIVELMQSEKPS
jgi:hypothetical protein